MLVLFIEDLVAGFVLEQIIRSEEPLRKLAASLATLDHELFLFWFLGARWVHHQLHALGPH